MREGGATMNDTMILHFSRTANALPKPGTRVLVRTKGGVYRIAYREPGHGIWYKVGSDTSPEMVLPTRNDDPIDAWAEIPRE